MASLGCLNKVIAICLAIKKTESRFPVLSLFRLSLKIKEDTGLSMFKREVTIIIIFILSTLTKITKKNKRRHNSLSFFSLPNHTFLDIIQFSFRILRPKPIYQKSISQNVSSLEKLTFYIVWIFFVGLPLQIEPRDCLYKCRFKFVRFPFEIYV